MRRRQLSLLLLLLAGVALWLTRPFWLPSILAQLPLLEGRADLLQGLDALVNLIGLAANGGMAYLLWVSQREEGEERRWEMEPLRSATPQEIRAGLGRSGQVNWIDRQAIRVGDLRAHGKLVIGGRMKLGKTREAAELIRRAVVEGLVLQGRIYEPNTAFRLLGKESLRTALRRFVDPQGPTLLFVDDLPRHFYGQGLEQLDEALAVLREYKAAYVVATARTDQLTDAHRDWLRQRQFHIIELPDLDGEQTGRLVDGAAGTFDLQVDDAARAEFVAEGDGTPELTLRSLLRLRVEGVTQVDQETAQRTAQRSLTESWAEARRYIRERVRAAGYLLDALATFHAAGVEVYAPLVLGYAAYLWRQGNRWRHPWYPRPALRRALDYVAHFDIVARGGQVAYPDAAVEGLMAPGTARERLGTFLERHRRLFQRRGLRRLYRDAGPHMLALVYLAFAAFEQEEYKAAVRFCSAAIRVRPHYGAYNNRGLVYYELQDYERAIEDYGRAVELNPEYAVAYFNRGLAYYELGDYQRAIEDFGRAVELDPEDAAAYYNRGLAYAQLQDYERAIEDYGRAVELNPEYAVAYNNRGLAYARLEDYERAIEDYGRAVELDPEYAEAYNNRGNAYARLEDYERAIEDYGRAVELGPEYAAAYNNRGGAYYELEDYQRAIEDYGRAVELDPEYAATYHNRGLAYYELEDYQRAIEDYGRAVALNPEEAATYNNRGGAYAELQDYQRAIEDFGRAVELNPEYAAAYHNRGLAYVELQDYERAVEDFGRAVDLNPEYAAAYNLRGLAYYELEDYERAIEDFGRAVELNPEKAATYHNRGAAYARLEDYERAIEDYGRAVELNPEDAAAYNNRGLAYARLEDYERAMEDYGRAVGLNPEYATAYYNMACAYALMGNVAQACEWLQKAVALDEKYREMARHDADFGGIREDESFQTLVGGGA